MTTKQSEPKFSPIAVVGASSLFPGSIDGQSFWRNILAGEDFMSEIPEDHWLINDYYDPEPGKKGKIYGKRGAFLPKVDFDPMEFGLPPKQLSTTDTAQLLGMIVAKKVLDDVASVQFGKVNKSEISVILGVASATEMAGQMAASIQRPNWVKALRDAGIPESKVNDVCDGIEGTYPDWDESTFPGLLGNVVAGRIANRLNLGGTNCVVDAACASSLGAVSMAIGELQSGNSELVITGGVDALNNPLMYMCFSQTFALSPSGDCRPFSADADGTMLGEGIGMLALRRLIDAERDGDRIYALIRGVGSSSDGRSGSIYAPVSKGQALAIRRAYEATDFDVDQVELIEAHGTATKAGDVAEFGGLQRAFAHVSHDRRQWCALGSVKSQIGHTKAAAGTASLFKVVMALHHKILPTTIKVSEPNPALGIDESPFYLNTQTRPWIHDPESTRKGSVSSFGFGGSNFHLTLEEYSQQGEGRGRYHCSPVELLLFSAATATEVIAAARQAAEQLSECALQTLAARLQQDFDSGNSSRLAILAEGRESAKAQIQLAAEKIKAQPDEAFSMPNRIYYGVGDGHVKVGFLFPGQGSQYVNMGADLACEFDQVRKAWDAASTIELDKQHRLDQVVFPIPVFSDTALDEQTAFLTRTEWAQPAIGCVSWSMLNLLETLGLKADAVAGHSYGEVTALYAAGTLSTPQSLLEVSRYRGELMKQAASIPGSMTAVLAGKNEVQAYLDQWDSSVRIANFNGPEQVVIAGETGEIEQVEQQLKAVGSTFRRLPVATAFHTDIVSPCAKPFFEFLNDTKISKPRIPVYSNTSASKYSTKPSEIRKTLAWQLAYPVRFQEMIETMHDDGIRLFLEVGPNSLLSGLVKDCLDGRDFSVVSLDARKQDGRAAFWNALGSLSASGIALNFDALWQDFAEVEALPESIKRSPVTVKLGGAIHGKPYPPFNGSAGVPKPNPELPHEVTVAAKATQQQPSTARIPPTSPLMSEMSPTVAEQIASGTHLQSDKAKPPVRDANWLAAFQSLQQQTLEAQKSFQQTLGEAHQAFLRASEATLAQLCGSATLETPIPSVTQAQASPEPERLADSAARHTSPSPSISYLPLQTSNPAPATPVPGNVPATNPAITPATTSATNPTTTSATSNSGIDYEAMLLDIVAEKTGYPTEMLTLDMELESGLGIDSIKRVEILSSLQEQLPHLGELDTGVLAELNTLGEIIDFASGSSSAISKPGPAIEQATREEAIAEMTRYEVVSEPCKATGIAIGQIHKAEPLYLVGDRSGVAEHLAELLAKIGIKATATDRAPDDAQWLILMTGLNSLNQSKVSDLVNLNVEAFENIRLCAKKMSESGRLLVTVQATGGDFGLAGSAQDAGWSSGIAALAKTACREWSKVAVKAIDVGTDKRSSVDIAQALLAELVAGGPELDVGLPSDGQRLTLVTRPTVGAGQGVALQDNYVAVVSGGARGVTAACLRELLGRQPAKLAILGRTPLAEEALELASFETDAELKKGLLRQYTRSGQKVSPIELNREVKNILNSREVRSNLKQLETTGSSVMYLPTDISDAACVEKSVAKVREEYGPINVIVHAAGVLADKEIQHKTDEQFQSVFQTKVAGLQNLLSTCKSDPLTHLVCFSSVAARTGNTGQVDYCMANEVLNRVCQAEKHKRGAGFSAKSIGWGPWAGGMVDPSLARHFRAQGVELIPLSDGAGLFADEIQGRNGDCVEILYGSGLLHHSPDVEVKQMAIYVHSSRHPQLASHEIHGCPVVPLAMVNEWCLNVASALNPSLRVVGVRDLNVVKGIQLKNFDGIGDWLSISCKMSESGDLLNMSVTDGEGVTCYQMGIELGFDDQQETEAHVLENLELDCWEWEAEKIYQDHLFHGKDLQVVKELLGISEAGCSGMLEIPDDADPSWWRVALLDGGFQLAVLWERHRSGLSSLPTRVGYLHWHQTTKFDGPVICELLLESATKLSTSWSIVFSNIENQVIATMEGVKIHVLLGKPFKTQMA